MSTARVLLSDLYDHQLMCQGKQSIYLMIILSCADEFDPHTCATAGQGRQGREGRWKVLPVVAVWDVWVKVTSCQKR
jgi:hypothetical protein